MTTPARPCQHPPARRYAWFARDDTAHDGTVLCVVCCDCGAVLAGAGELVDVTNDEEGGHVPGTA